MYFIESQNTEGHFGFKRNEALTFKLILGLATVARQSCAGQIRWQCLYLDVLTSLQCSSAKSLQSCLTLCNPMDCSPPGSSVHGILQARILEWVAISFSRGSYQGSNSGHLHCRQILYHLSHQTLSFST